MLHCLSLIESVLILSISLHGNIPPSKCDSEIGNTEPTKTTFAEFDEPNGGFSFMISACLSVCQVECVSMSTLDS